MRFKRWKLFQYSVKLSFVGVSALITPGIQWDELVQLSLWISRPPLPPPPPLFGLLQLDVCDYDFFFFFFLFFVLQGHRNTIHTWYVFFASITVFEISTVFCFFVPPSFWKIALKIIAILLTCNTSTGYLCKPINDYELDVVGIAGAKQQLVVNLCVRGI